MLGKIISHYKIVERIGSGGIGVVYKALDIDLDRYVAIKFLPLSFSHNKEDKERFIQEAKAASSFDHPNICTIHEIQETNDGQLFIVMAFYEGKTLDHCIKDGTFSLDEKVNIIIQVAKALSKAHSQGIVHRDIKPSNIIITPDKAAKILDFGLAQYLDQDQVTRTSSTQGTIAYMSPEQAQGLEVDHRTDIWSLTVVLYELLTGQLPFTGKYYQAMLYSIVNLEPAPINEQAPDVPLNFQEFFDGCFNKSQNNRPDSFDQFVDLLKTVVETTADGPTKHNASQTIIPRRKYNWIIMGSTFALIIILITIFLYQENLPPEPLPLKERMTLALTDAINETGNENYDSISGLFEYGLEQSGKLSVLTREQIIDAHLRLGLKEPNKIDRKNTRKIIKAAQIDIVAVPTIRKYGNLFTLEISLFSPLSNKSPKTPRRINIHPGGIPDAIDELCLEIRRWLKENEDLIQQNSQKLADMSTENINAFEHFSQGEEYLAKRQFNDARLEYLQATKLDSAFGLAYYKLALATGLWNGDEHPERHLLLKALKFVDNIPKKYKFLIHARMALLTTGYPASIEELSLMENFYPNNKEMLYFMGSAYFSAKNYDKAIKYLNKLLDQDKFNFAAYQLLLKIYRNTHNYDKALEIAEGLKRIDVQIGAYEAGQIDELLRNFPSALNQYQQSRAVDPNNAEVLSRIMAVQRKMGEYGQMKETANLLMHAAEGDFSKYFKEAVYSIAYSYDYDFGFEKLALIGQFDKEKKVYVDLEICQLYDYEEQYEESELTLLPLTTKSYSPQINLMAFDRLYRTYLYMGRYREAQKMCDKQSEINSDLEKFKVIMDLRKALISLWGWNDTKKALQEADPAIKSQKDLSSNGYWEHLNALYQHANMPDSSEKIIRERFENQGAKNEESILSSLAGNCDRASSLVDSLEYLVAARERLRALYHLINCYDKNNEPENAIKYIIKLRNTIDYSGGWRAAYYPKSFFMQARQYEKLGDTKNAISYYEKFLNLWKNADKDLADYREATHRLLALQNK